MSFFKRIDPLKEALKSRSLRYARYEKRKRELFRMRNRHDEPIYPSRNDEWVITRGDLVEVIKGRDEGKQGKVKMVLRKKETAIVEGINKRFQYGVGEAGESMTKWRESPVLLKNLALVDQDTQSPTRVEFKYLPSEVDPEKRVRVRQSSVSGEVITKPKESRPKRVLRSPHPTKDTLPKVAQMRTWIGPWEFFTPNQQKFMIEDMKKKQPNMKNVEEKLPDLIYDNVDEVQEYIARYLPKCPHTHFHPGTCLPYQYETYVQRWSQAKLQKMLKSHYELDNEHKQELFDQLRASKLKTHPRYITHPVDPNSHWPRVKPSFDPKFLPSSSSSSFSSDSQDQFQEHENENENENEHENEDENKNKNENENENENEKRKE